MPDRPEGRFRVALPGGVWAQVADGDLANEADLQLGFRNELATGLDEETAVDLH